MSFDKLPREVLDQVCEELDWFGDDDAVKTLLSFCLTCHSSLSSARRELYRYPLHDEAVAKHPSSPVLLLRTLTSSPHLAPLVHHLEGLGCIMHEGHTPGGEVVDEQAKLVKICPRLYSLTLFLVNVAQAQDLPPLVSTLSHLKSLLLDVSVSEGNPRALLSAWNSAYASTSPASHTQLIVRPRYLRTLPSDRPFADTPLPSFITDLKFAFNATAVGFVEGYQTPLAHLDTVTIDCTDLASLTALVVVVTKSRLRSSIYGGSPLVDRIPFDVSWSRDDSAELDVPPIFFTSFPTVTSFTLTWTCRMTIAKLSLLANTSSSLEVLDLTGTMWTVEAAHFVPHNGGASTVELQLIDILRRLPSLRKVHLGLFRVDEDKQPFEKLERNCESRTPELKLSWQGVRRG